MTDVLIIGDTERSPELRHEIPIHIGDPFLYAEVDGRRVAIVWSIEGDRIAAIDPTIEIVSDETFSSDDLIRDGVDIYAIKPTMFGRQVRSLGLGRAAVPRSFPLGIADVLRANGVELVVDQRLFDDRRRRKTAFELEGIRRASRAAEAGMTAIASLLARSEPADGGRVVDGDALTSDVLKLAASAEFDRHGCRGDDLIVAIGPQAADGHDQGQGPVGNDDVVLCDLFPQHVESGCFSDMTRTFVVGGANAEISAWHTQSVEALELARSLVRPGTSGSEIHRAVCSFFERLGHPTGLSKPEGEVLRDGFFHGLGHGVGLDVHEAPWLGKFGHELVEGDVIALEPGLYRHGFGGVRVEDLLVVTADGCETLTIFPYALTPA